MVDAAGYRRIEQALSPVEMMRQIHITPPIEKLGEYGVKFCTIQTFNAAEDVMNALDRAGLLYSERLKHGRASSGPSLQPIAIQMGANLTPSKLMFEDKSLVI